MANPDQDSKPATGTLLLILIQVASRALTFIGNQFLLRFVSPSLLGIAVQLELVSVTSLYFARESLRVALQRQPLSSQRHQSSTAPSTRSEKASRGTKTQTVVNLAYLAILLGFGVSAFFGYSYLWSAAGEVLDSPYFDPSFRIYAAATLIELLAEPAFVVIQQNALYKARATAETSAAMARCFAACLVAVVGHRRGIAPSIMPFAVGQAAYAITLLAFYLLPTLQLSRKGNFSLGPRRVSSAPTDSTYYSGLFHSAILSLATTMYMQSIFKLLLTQGDVLILSFLSSLADQGAFALASNYGGLLARLLFQPIEESSRNTFGRLLSSLSTSTQSQRNSQTDISQALKYLANTLHFYLLISLPLTTLAPFILPLVVKHIIGARWYSASTASLLSTYCFYIPLMAVNGILDAFVTSVATPVQLRTQSLWMLVFTVLYGVAAWGMLTRFGMGAAGLVGANMVNMGLRIVWSIDFVRKWIAGNVKREHKKDLVRETVSIAIPARASIAVAGLVGLGLRMGGLGDSDGQLNRPLIEYLTAGTVLMGSAM